MYVSVSKPDHIHPELTRIQGLQATLLIIRGDLLNCTTSSIFYAYTAIIQTT